MAHFCELDESNVVLRVPVIANEDITDENGDEQESLGIAFCTRLYGESNWVQTSYNHTFRKEYAGIGMTYDSVKDKFIRPQPYPSWTLNDNDDWEAPTPYPFPEDGLPYDNDFPIYIWDEDTLSWVDMNA